MESYYYRVQQSGEDWILRHPDYPLVLIRHSDIEEVLKQLPDYFKNFKKPVLVKIFHDSGRRIEERTYP